MRFSAALVLCAGLSLTAAGCDPQTDQIFFRQGIGTELNSGDIAASTTSQNDYVRYVCQQAGLAYDDDSISCGSNRPAEWQLFVQAEMNDIDQRCDAYLLWLDYVRRAKDPTLNVIADAATYSAFIMDRAGVSAAPIAITGAALGFARNTFTNVTSRLILEVNHSAVQSVVLTAQKGFREELLGSGDSRLPPVVIASKPAAIYALRSYLRLCMPATIEAEINNTVVTFARGGPQALYEQEPLVSGRNVSVTATAMTLNVTKPIKATQQPGVVGNAMSVIEKTIDPKQATHIQAALCVKKPDGNFGGVGSETRGDIQAFKAALNVKPGDQEVGVITNAPDLDNVTQATHKFPFCPKAGFASAYEVGTIQKYGVEGFREKLVRQLTKVNTAGVQVADDLINKLKTTPQQGIALDADSRSAIEILSKHYNVPAKSGRRYPTGIVERLRGRPGPCRPGQ